MATLQILNEEQLKKAEELKKSLEVELRDPLLEGEEREKIQAKHDRWATVIKEYRDRTNPPPAEEDISTVPTTEKRPITIQEAAPPTQDPRPDLSADSQLWSKLLQMAAEQDNEAGRLYGKDDNTFCGVLSGFRCNGTILTPAKPKGEPMWALKPVIDVSDGWESKEEYDDFKRRYLEPYGKQLIGLLRELTRRHPLPKEEGAGE